MNLLTITLDSERFEHRDDFSRLCDIVLKAQKAVDEGNCATIRVSYDTGYYDDITPYMEITISRKETNEEYEARMRDQEARTEQAKINKEIEERRLFARLKKKYEE